MSPTAQGKSLKEEDRSSLKLFIAALNSYLTYGVELDFDCRTKCMYPVRVRRVGKNRFVCVACLQIAGNDASSCNSALIG